MALSNQTDPQQAASALGAWLSSKLDAQVDVVDAVIPADAGLSTETILFEARWDEGGAPQCRRLVARVQPTGDAVFPSYDLASEARLLGALGSEAEVPVPRVFDHEPDAGVLGAPFLVMDRIDGRVPSDDPPFTASGWVLELSPEEQARLYDNALQAMAAIHRVDHERLGLRFLAEREPGEPGLDQQLGYWERTFAWATEGEENPTITGALEWIRGHRPGPEPLVLNWGDARPGNILFGDDVSVAGVLDWEMAGLASPEMDLGWWLFLLRHHTEGIGVPAPAGFPDRAGAIARYEELTGHEVRHVDFYEVFAGMRLAILMHRAGRLMIGAGLLPPDAPMKLNNPATQLLAKLTGQPAPDGTAQSFIGNR